MRIIAADELEKKWTIASPEPYNTDAVEVLDSIRNMPTIDAVRVVRCKDCKYRDGTPGQPNILCGNMHEEDISNNGDRKHEAKETSIETQLQTTKHKQKEVMYYFWGRAEYEVMIGGLFERGQKAKIDIYSQLKLNWDRFIDYLWNEYTSK